MSAMAEILVNGVRDIPPALRTEGVTVALTNTDDTDVITWTWTLVEKPEGSTPVFTPGTATASSSSAPTFGPLDIYGTYIIRLAVNDGSGMFDSSDVVDEVSIRVQDATIGVTIPAKGERVQGGTSGWAEGLISGHNHALRGIIAYVTNMASSLASHLVADPAHPASKISMTAGTFALAGLTRVQAALDVLDHLGDSTPAASGTELVYGRAVGPIGAGSLYSQLLAIIGGVGGALPFATVGPDPSDDYPTLRDALAAGEVNICVTGAVTEVGHSVLPANKLVTIWGAGNTATVVDMGAFVFTPAANSWLSISHLKFSYDQTVAGVHLFNDIPRLFMDDVYFDINTAVTARYLIQVTSNANILHLQNVTLEMPNMDAVGIYVTAAKFCLIDSCRITGGGAACFNAIVVSNSTIRNVTLSGTFSSTTAEPAICLNTNNVLDGCEYLGAGTMYVDAYLNNVLRSLKGNAPHALYIEIFDNGNHISQCRCRGMLVNNGDTYVTIDSCILVDYYIATGIVAMSNCFINKFEDIGAPTDHPTSKYVNCDILSFTNPVLGNLSVFSNCYLDSLTLADPVMSVVGCVIGSSITLSGDDSVVSDSQVGVGITLDAARTRALNCSTITGRVTINVTGANALVANILAGLAVVDNSPGGNPAVISNYIVV